MGIEKFKILPRGVAGKELSFVVILLVLFSVSSLFGQDAKMYKNGKRAIRERKWDKAIQSYDQLLQQYPKSLYGDDAQFWIGFSWEQTPGQQKKAFDCYQKLIENYPHSPWVDDAQIHQIYLAKKMIQNGERDYEAFLRLKLNDSDQTVRYQAALALGEVKNPMVLPILEEMAKGQDEEIAKRAMEALEGYSRTLDEKVEEVAESLEKDKVNVRPSTDTISNIMVEKLYRTGGAWTEEELLLNGLYHIVSEEELTFYLNLENDWDRKEWWRKQWITRDPTPTTPENEAEEEYKRRVQYAYKHFGREWKLKENYYPPWDSRGELYIKFGKPDRREEAEEGWELWTFYRYKVNFLVSNNLPNIKGEGVDLGRVSRYLYRNNIRRKRTNTIQKPNFLYVNPSFKEAKHIKDFDFRITSTSRAGSIYRIRFTYQFPATNLRFKEENDKLEGAYRYRWVVFDEDYHIRHSFDTVEDLTYTDKEAVIESKVFGNFHVSLEPGSYTLALRIEGIRSNALGIYRKKFTIQSKGDIQEM